MELGALICRPKVPLCAECPVKAQCKGKAHPERYPEPKPKVKWKTISEEKWILIRLTDGNPQVYLEQNQAGSWRMGLWDFPMSLDQKGMPKARLKAEFQIKYVVTNHKVTRAHRVFSVKNASGLGLWFDLGELPALPAPASLAMKHLKKLRLFGK